MTRPLGRRRTLFGAGLLLLALLLPTASRAATAGCERLQAPGAVAEVLRGRADASAVQSGLRVVFGTDNGFLRDNVVGPVTLSLLAQLCAAVPLAAGTEPVAGTVDLARSYAARSRTDPGWPARIADPGLLTAAEAAGFRRDIVRLAGGDPALAASAGEGDCAAIASTDLALPADDLAALEAALGALAAADPGLQPVAGGEAPGGPATRAALARLCAAFPDAGAAALTAMMVRLGHLTAADPAALATLGAPAFAAWLGERQAVRLTRLLGTVPAVMALLAEYRAGAPAAPAPGSVPVAAAAPACAADAPADGPGYYALDPADLTALEARAGIADALAPVAAQRFDDRDDLVAAIDAVLGVHPPDCAARRVDTAVARHADASTVYSLDPDKLKPLALEPQLAQVLPAVAPLQGLESESRDRLAAGVGAAIRTAVGKVLDAGAAQAADTAAAAAEDVSPAPDTPAPGIPPAAAAGERPQAFAITDTSLLLIKAGVPDPAFFAAISAAPYKPLPSRELVRSETLAALQPVVAGRSDDLAKAGLEKILPNLRPHWRLADAVTGELAADPSFAAVDPAALRALAGLSGIAYPSGRLFDRALASLPVPIGEADRSAILDVARKQVADPYARRHVAPVASDCGCNVARRDHSQVYAFYPFWEYAGAGADPTPLVDFSLVGRIAFDGLVLDRHGDLHYAAQWSDAAATFTVSAHRHQAAVDLGIRLVGWRNWTTDQVSTAARHVIEEMTKPRTTEQLVASNGPLSWLDSYLDRRPDGVTLIAEGYTGNPSTGPGAEKLVALIRRVAVGLEGTGETINLAFDIPLPDDDTADDPLFQDLRALIVNLDDPDSRPVKTVLVTLQRQTTRSKKYLRSRVENSFKGDERIQVLRSIIPVVPPGANASLGREQRTGDEEAATTTEADSYGQFRDDAVYFQDNFGGIGFWPAPAAGATLPDGSPDRLGEIVADRYYAWTPPLIPPGLRAPIRDGIDGVCTLVCPNRLAFHLTSAATAGLIGGLLLLGLYSGRVRSLSRRLLLLPILMLALLALLVITVVCDRSSLTWAPGAILAMVLLMSGSVLFQWYERRVDGPMP